MKRIIHSASKYSSDVIRKISLLEQMNEVMKSMNNENAYYTWIYTVPDEATREDFEDIAMDDEFFNECRALFDKLYKRYHKDGLYNPSSFAYNYAMSTDKRLHLDSIEVFRK